MKLCIATRGSALALWQAEHVRGLLQAREPELEVELLVLKTQGDRILDRPLQEVGGKGLFVKEIEEALLDGRAQVAVHSMKDLPAAVPEGLVIAAVPERQDPRDALVLRAHTAAADLSSLPRGAKLGTSSLRRVCQLKALRPDLEVVSLRGNVDTRLRRLDEGELDAIVLACAGLRRLGYAERISSALSVTDSLPAIGQGALALECRVDDPATRDRLFAFDHPRSAQAVAAERAFLSRLDGGCRTPLGAHGTIDGERLRLDGLVGDPSGELLLRDRVEGAAVDGPELGRQLAERLLARGADAILAKHRAPRPVGGP